MASNEGPSSRKSAATHKHQDGSKKIDPAQIPGVNVVRNPRTGEPEKIAVTERGAKRLIDELGR